MAKFKSILLALILLVPLSVNGMTGNTEHFFKIQQTRVNFDAFSIDGETELEDFVVDNGFSGDGTVQNPYIIENLLLSGFISYQIRLANTVSYVIFRNLEINDGTSGGMQLFQSSNVIIENCIFNKNYGDGIHLNKTSNIKISNNLISNTFQISVKQKANGRWNFPFAIDVESSDHVEIDNNTLFGNVDGIWLFDYVTDSVVYGNTINNHHFDGIGQGGPLNYNIQIYDNTISNTRYGIWSVGGSSVEVINNAVLNSNIGLLVEYTDFGNYSLNSLVDNDLGMRVGNTAESSSVMYNLFKDNKGYGLEFDTNDMTIEFNAFIENNNGRIQTSADSSGKFDIHSNFYNDLEPYDEDGDAIVDTEYSWDGTSNATDPTPTTTPSKSIPQEYNDYENTWRIEYPSEGFLSFSLMFMFILGEIVIILISSRIKKSRIDRPN